MTDTEEKDLKAEIAHIFDSGANEIRVFEMVKNFINKPTPDLDSIEVLTLEEWSIEQGYVNKWSGFYKDGKSISYWILKNRYFEYKNNLLN